ncbi:hypothetical protein C8Q79DRAFT_1004663 [Trametes meyenii]|nr:hypothetical protein C8Q79DRAFT_1004663 [Trametes meyenii]
MSREGSEVTHETLPSSLIALHILASAMDAFFTIAPPVPIEAPADVPVENDGYGTGGNHTSCTIACLGPKILPSHRTGFEGAMPVPSAAPHFIVMDAFFTIAPAVPVEEKPIEDVLVEGDRVGSGGGNHLSCVIA